MMRKRKFVPDKVDIKETIYFVAQKVAKCYDLLPLLITNSNAKLHTNNLEHKIMKIFIYYIVLQE